VHETYFPTKQPSPLQEAWFSPSYEHPRWPRDLEVSPGKGSSPAFRLIGRIRHREVFSRLSKEGTYVRSQGLWCSLLLDGSLENPHIGYAIGRQVGGAVERNRIKRQLRALFEAKSSQLRPGWYLVGVTPQVAGSSWNHIGVLVDRLIGQIDAKISQTIHGAQKMT
jgi:ribonuclease P protein component